MLAILKNSKLNEKLYLIDPQMLDYALLKYFLFTNNISLISRSYIHINSPEIVNIKIYKKCKFDRCQYFLMRTSAYVAYISVTVVLQFT